MARGALTARVLAELLIVMGGGFMMLFLGMVNQARRQSSQNAAGWVKRFQPEG